MVHVSCTPFHRTPKRHALYPETKSWWKIFDLKCDLNIEVGWSFRLCRSDDWESPSTRLGLAPWNFKEHLVRLTITSLSFSLRNFHVQPEVVKVIRERNYWMPQIKVKNFGDFDEIWRCNNLRRAVPGSMVTQATASRWCQGTVRMHASTRLLWYRDGRVLERSTSIAMHGTSVGNENFSALDYGDDVALLTELMELLQSALEVFAAETAPIRLVVNRNKTKIQSQWLPTTDWWPWHWRRTSWGRHQLYLPRDHNPQLMWEWAGDQQATGYCQVLFQRHGSHMGVETGTSHQSQTLQCLHCAHRSLCLWDLNYDTNQQQQAWRLQLMMS